MHFAPFFIPFQSFFSPNPLFGRGGGVKQKNIHPCLEKKIPGLEKRHSLIKKVMTNLMVSMWVVEEVLHGFILAAELDPLLGSHLAVVALKLGFGQVLLE